MSFEIDASFAALRAKMESAYGFGLSPDRNAIDETIGSALVLTSAIFQGTQEEFHFYKSASQKVSPATDTLQSLQKVVDAAALRVGALERRAEEVRVHFLSKTPLERTGFLTSQTYHDIVNQANADAWKIADVAQRIKNLLFRRAPDSSLNPFQDIAAFAAHRKAVSQLYNQAADIGSRQAKAMTDLTPEMLYASDTIIAKVQSALDKYRLYLGSFSLGAAIIAAGEYGLNPGAKAVTYCLGTLIAASPWFFSSSNR